MAFGQANYCRYMRIEHSNNAVTNKEQTQRFQEVREKVKGQQQQRKQLATNYCCCCCCRHRYCRTLVARPTDRATLQPLHQTATKESNNCRKHKLRSLLLLLLLLFFLLFKCISLALLLPLSITDILNQILKSGLYSDPCSMFIMIFFLYSLHTTHY